MKKLYLLPLLLTATILSANANNPDELKINGKTIKVYGNRLKIDGVSYNEGDVIRIGNGRINKRIDGSGIEASETRKAKSFNSINSTMGIDVYLTQGNGEAIEVKADKNILPYVKTVVENGVLKVCYEDDISIKLNKVRTKVYVTAKEIKSLSTSSSGNIIIQGILKANDLTIKTSSSGDITGNIECAGYLKVSTSSSGDIVLKGSAANATISASSSGDITATLRVENDIDISSSSSSDITMDVTAESCSVSASSTGEITLKGKCRTAKVNASSSGEIDMENMECEDVVAKASSAGDITLWATQSLEASASSGGEIEYRGNPTVKNISKSSGGTVKKD